jgi:hypothetical protein
MKQLIKINVNGDEYEVAVRATTTLLDLLREELKQSSECLSCAGCGFGREKGTDDRGLGDRRGTASDSTRLY